MKKHTKDATTQGTDGRRWGRRPAILRGRPEVVSSTSRLDSLLLAAGYAASRYFSPLRHTATTTPSSRRATATIAFFLPRRFWSCSKT